ncbi:hypothetical protein COY27_00180 [Candidatus Woesearchaeota archaeon CG_4_10_14_0_2_um_filter_33_13]|nr:MAG: hypothetical protein COY27_00180 [Candidatus Woesearchaeota archaeon CG_4_10_14_0_2_um_filter_33_13]
MVQFGSSFATAYAMPMDRDYSGSSASPGNQSTNDVNVSIGEIGMSIGLGPVPNVQAVGAKLRAGTKTVELGFMGSGKGSGQGHTPEMYGKVQRQAFKELQKANRVDFTTHASVGVYGLAGMDQQGNFSKQNRNMAVDEIKRAVDFASDVAQGGPVVVHTGEFYRPLVDAEWNDNNKFKMYEGEEERASFRVVDARTGGVIQEARKNRKVARPIWNTATEGAEYLDFDGKTKQARSEYDEQGRLIYMDYFGNRISDENRVPMFNAEKGQFEVRQMDWKDLQAEAKQMTLRAREVWRGWKDGVLSEKELHQSYWDRFKDVTSEEEILVKPEEAYIISTLETNAANSRGWAYQYGSDFEETVKTIKKMKKAKEVYDQLEASTDEEEKWKLKKEIGSQFGDLIPPESKFPSEILRERIVQLEARMKQAQEASAGQWSQAEESKETIRHVESADSYALRESFSSYAEAGIRAMERTKQLMKQGVAKKPIALAMENLFPESYGSHPDELAHLVVGSREKMAEMLRQRGMSESEANAKAKDHITATFDTGHLNMWKKYWRGDPNKSLEQNDEEFKKWTLKKVENLAKSGVVGHLHLVDNYGYQDDHLAPGQGNAPIKEIVEIFKKHGYKGEMIVEPGADYTTDVSGFHSVMKSWKLFGSGVYGASGAAPRKPWGQVQYGYFGQTQPPYFTFGGYSPSEDWTLWSGVPLE